MGDIARGHVTAGMPCARTLAVRMPGMPQAPPIPYRPATPLTVPSSRRSVGRHLSTWKFSSAAASATVPPPQNTCGVPQGSAAIRTRTCGRLSMSMRARSATCMQTLYDHLSCCWCWADTCASPESRWAAPKCGRRLIRSTTTRFSPSAKLQYTPLPKSPGQPAPPATS